MNIRLPFTLVLLAMFAGGRLAAAFNPAAPLFTRLSGTVVVPAEVTHRSLFVRVTINGHGPFRMLVDTGSSVPVLTPAVAAAVEAREASTDPLRDNPAAAGDEPADLPQVLLRTLEIGGAKFEGVRAVVTDDPGVFNRLDETPVDGVIGFSVFSDVVLGLDFPGRRLVISADWPKGLPPVRAELDVREPAQVPLVNVRLQGRDLEVLVDTGSEQGLELTRDFARLVHWKAEPRPGPMVTAVGEGDRQYVGRLSGELHLGPATQEDPIAAIIDGSPSVGVGFLRSFCVVFDQAHDKMWLCSDSDDPVRTPPARSLGLGLLADAGGWRVADTIPGSPAEGAGITSGDMVTEIQGEPARAWSKDRIDRWTDTHDRVALRVAHVDQSRDLVLSVWPLVP